MGLEGVEWSSKAHREARQEIASLSSACERERANGIAALAEHSYERGSDDLRRRHVIGGYLTRRAEELAEKYGLLGVDVEPHVVIGASADEYRAMVKERPFFYWDEPEASELPPLVSEYHKISGEAAPVERRSPTVRVDLVPYVDKWSELESGSESEIGHSVVRAGIEGAAKVYLTAHGVPPEAAAAAVWLTSRSLVGPKTTTEKLIGIAPVIIEP